jgi:hypothetical protein
MVITTQWTYVHTIVSFNEGQERINTFKVRYIAWLIKDKLWDHNRRRGGLGYIYKGKETTLFDPCI